MMTNIITSNNQAKYSNALEKYKGCSSQLHKIYLVTFTCVFFSFSFLRIK